MCARPIGPANRLSVIGKRLAADGTLTLTAARVEIVREREGLRRHDGVTATLRYRR